MRDAQPENLDAASSLILAGCPIDWAGAAPPQTSCLSYDEQRALAALNARTLKQFCADELENKGPKMVQLMSQMTELRDQIDECQRASEGTVAGAPGLQSCSSLIRRYNRMNQELRAMTAELKSRQELINTMLQLNRSQFRNCD